MPLYDSTGRLFLHSEDPTPADPEGDSRMFRNYLEYGIWTINNARALDGLPPVPWGEVPWLPAGLEPATAPRHRRHTRPY